MYQLYKVKHNEHDEAMLAGTRPAADCCGLPGAAAGSRCFLSRLMGSDGAAPPRPLRKQRRKEAASVIQAIEPIHVKLYKWGIMKPGSRQQMQPGCDTSTPAASIIRQHATRHHVAVAAAVSIRPELMTSTPGGGRWGHRPLPRTEHMSRHTGAG